MSRGMNSRENGAVNNGAKRNETVPKNGLVNDTESEYILDVTAGSRTRWPR